MIFQNGEFRDEDKIFLENAGRGVNLAKFYKDKQIIKEGILRVSYKGSLDDQDCHHCYNFEKYKRACLKEILKTRQIKSTNELESEHRITSLSTIL